MYVLSPKEQVQFQKGFLLYTSLDTAVICGMYSSEINILHDVVILYHVRMVQYFMTYRFKFVLRHSSRHVPGGSLYIHILRTSLTQNVRTV